MSFTVNNQTSMLCPSPGQAVTLGTCSGRQRWVEGTQQQQLHWKMLTEVGNGRSYGFRRQGLLQNNPMKPWCPFTPILFHPTAMDTMGTRVADLGVGAAAGKEGGRGKGEGGGGGSEGGGSSSWQRHRFEALTNCSVRWKCCRWSRESSRSEGEIHPKKQFTSPSGLCL